MSPPEAASAGADSAPLRTIAFGDLEAGIWGASWGAADPFLAVVQMRADATASCPAVTVEGTGAEAEWGLVAQGVELTLSPHGDLAPEAGDEGFDQLCRVRGRLTFEGSEQSIDCLGRRGIRPSIGMDELDSVHDLSAWFGPAEGLAVSALRPRGAAGHDRDRLSAVLFDSTGAVRVAETRLSTTYTAAETPSRVSLELWLAADDEADQYPRRAAGEAIGAGTSFAHAGTEVQVHAFRWHSGGQEGTGTDLLLRAA